MARLRRSRVLFGMAALVLTVVGLAVAPSASAESGSASDKADKAQAGEQHCVVNMKTDVTQCFGTFRESIAHATAGRVTDGNLSAETGTADSKTTTELNTGGPGVAAVVIGVEYYWQNYNCCNTPAYTLTYSGGVACTTTLGDLDYRDAVLPTYTINWNNNIRSFRGYNNCWQRMWDYGNCTGLLLNYSPYSADLGAARDRTECIDWS